MRCNEEAVDKTIEEAADTVQAAEKLSFLSEQQLYDVEKQYRLQEQRLLEVQTMLQLKEAENAKLKKRISELERIQKEEEERIREEFHAEQWHMVRPPASSSEPSSNFDATGYGYGKGVSFRVNCRGRY